jgi:hypothetical protein
MDIHDDGVVKSEQIEKLFCLKGGKGQHKVTAIEAAVKIGNKRMVERLLSNETLFLFLWDNEPFQVVKRAMSLANNNPEMYNFFKLTIRRFEMRFLLCFRCSDLKKVQTSALEYDGSHLG